MNRWFRPTRNPALIAQCEKLAKEAVAPGVRDGSGTQDSATSRHGTERTGTGGSVLGQCFGAEQRAQRALALLIDASRGVSGYLYAVTEGGLRLVAPLHGDAPPGALEHAITDEIEKAIEDDESTVVSEIESAHPSKPTAPRHGHGYGISLLTARLRGTRVIVGAAALTAGEGSLRVVPAKTLESIGDALYEAGDVSEYVT
jgi:hypothetical protein